MGLDSKIRIVIVEDHRLFREGLRLILKGEKDMEIVGEAVNGLQAIDVISELQPDVVLLDITMPELNGIQVIPLIKRKSSETKALMLTAAMDEDTVLKALKAGARGYLSKNAGVSNLIKGIKAVHEGEMWVERKLIDRLFDDEEIAAYSNGDDREEKTKESLTKREQEVLQLLIKGSTNKEIAQALFISEKTVKSHLSSIFKKLNVSRRLEAILCAIKLGLS